MKNVFNTLSWNQENKEQGLLKKSMLKNVLE